MFNVICLIFGHKFENGGGCKMRVISNECFRCGYIRKVLLQEVFGGKE